MNSPQTSEQFAAFYERSARPLWAYLARVSGDPSLADDLMQESYVRFLSPPPPADGEIESRRYLFRIASNLLRDHWRRPGTTSIDDLPENLFVAADTAVQIDSWALLAPAMARMRPRDRQLLWLAHAENYSHSEIARDHRPRNPQHPPAAVSRQKKNRPHPKAHQSEHRRFSARPEEAMKPCPHEAEIQAILRQGHWPDACDPEFRKHVETCRTCGDQLLVLHAFHAARAQAIQAAHIDHPNLLWWRAQLRRRNEALQRVSRPITTAQIFAFCISILAAAALLRSQ